ncbi:MAG: ATP phosphoribosyltransferase regulatory subunit [Pseudomonadota bacterium]
MSTSAAAQAKAKELLSGFEAAGATLVETPVLQPAKALLDLYGEDMRARAYVTSDALRGEQMLRPDFTVPVVQMHIEAGDDVACYVYSGKVFRRQEIDPSRPNEYLQVGIELFQSDDLENADARAFSSIYQSLKGQNLRADTGDIGILMDAVAGLHTTDRRKQALMRHIWRPKRFRGLLERFAGQIPVPESRARLLASDDPTYTDAPLIGLRNTSEIAERIDALKEDAAAPPISRVELSTLDALLSVSDRADIALTMLQEIARDMAAIAPAIARLERRLQALDQAGTDVAALDFEASYGRTQMEYYDGFVFGFYAENRTDLPPIASGGRYDALTRHLGQGRETPAVGGVIRPDLLIELEGAR